MSRSPFNHLPVPPHPNASKLAQPLRVADPRPAGKLRRSEIFVEPRRKNFPAPSGQHSLCRRPPACRRHGSCSFLRGYVILLSR